ncbi:ParB/RepB/Spo0J family partition protein [Haloplasma contractile]|uniref:Tryptophanyl-tRNA synthetase protein n=1 Tax=Haloplasma contractile SSD-17B TaxID=1033810 RepID=F7PWS2_9MOLU|nr:ParB/RepB/Spo0J family partition protein [Haloplasma contractile]ERJ12553.1 tryptophanyl-tRNA synthetase protein [Haloplasma contractile SSD-17B]
MSSRLGKGLGALFTENNTFEEEPQQGEQISQIPLENLRPNPYQPRKEFDEEKIEELKTSIEEHGVFQPIIVRKIENLQDKFYIVAGERRFRACRALGLETIPAIVRDIDDQIMAEVALLENLQRENLNAIEEAMAFKMLIEKYELTQSEVAKRVGKSRAHVTNMLRILNLPVSIQTYLNNEQIDFGHAKVLAGLDDPELMKELANQVIEEKLSVRALEQLTREKRNSDQIEQPKSKTVKQPERNVNTVALENDLISKLGTNVKINEGKNGGKLVIDFNDTKNLNDILLKMNLID